MLALQESCFRHIVCVEMLRIDILSTDKKFFLTCIDKFSKYAVVQAISSRTIEDLKPDLVKLMLLPKGQDDKT